MKTLALVSLAAVLGTALYVGATVLQVLEALDADQPWYGDDDA